ncbi:MAG: hypothetical protein IJB05_07995 [Bacteroidales bacterium]|nr:hypothetical protein [Bacteroidales bacterium]
MRTVIAVILLLFFWGGQYSAAQEFTPIVRSYDRGSYGADNYNWSVSAAADGVMYFGNGQGLLSFDGHRWNLVRLPENKIARTVHAEGEVLYVGSHEEFGYFFKDDYGSYEYVSLSALIPDYEMQNDEIWRIISYDGKVIFQSFTSFFVYDGVSVEAHRMPEFCLFFNVCGDRILTSAESSGLVRVDPLTGTFTEEDGVPFDSQLVSVQKRSDSEWLMVTYSDGIFIYDGSGYRRFMTEVDSELPVWQPNNAIMTPSGDIVIGTKLNGAVCIAADGRKKWNVSNSNVLNCNTVLGMSLDCNGNLWLALDGGLAKVNIDPSLTYIRSISPSVGSIFTIFYRDPYLYMGTGQGLYRGKLSEGLDMLTDVESIHHVLGNVWHIDSYGDQLFCGTNYDTFDLAGDSPVVASEVTGGFCMDEGKINGMDVIIQGTYTHPCIYLKKDGSWRFSHSLSDFMQPVNTIEIDYSGRVWAGHKYKGLYSFRLDHDLNGIDTLAFYPSLDGRTERPVSVYTINGRVVFLDGVTGFYTYDDLNDSIVPYTELNQALKDYPGSVTICHFRDNLYWFISSSQATLVSFSGRNVVVEDMIPYRIFGNNILDEDQSITPISDDRCIIALGNSLALYDLSAERQETDKEVRMSVSGAVMFDIDSQNDSLLPVSPESCPMIPYRYRNIRIWYSAPNYDEADGCSFIFSIDGNEWSAPSDDPYFTAVHLGRGRHTVSAQAVSATGEVISQTDYMLRVNYPFYMSVPAYIFYVIIVIAVVAGAVLSWIRVRNTEEMMKERALSEEEKESDEQRFQRILRERYPALTDNDLRFCACLRQNLSSKEIAAMMNISLKGVEAARARIRKKIGLSSSDSLTAFMVGLK